MTKDILIQIRKSHNNTILQGDGKQIGNLSVTKSQDAIYSCWKCESIWQRIIFLFKGEITLSVLSSSQPPVCLIVGDYVDKQEKKIKGSLNE